MPEIWLGTPKGAIHSELAVSYEYDGDAAPSLTSRARTEAKSSDTAEPGVQLE